MKSPKIIGGVLVIGFPLFMFLVIFGNSLDSNKEEVISPSRADRNDWVEIKNDKVRSESVEITSLSTNKNTEILKQVQDDISKKIAKSIIDLNTDGFTNLNDQQFAKALNPEKVVGDILGQDIKEIERLSLTDGKPVVDISVNKIISGATQKQKENYLESVNKISEKIKATISGLKITSPAHFSQLAKVYDQSANELRQLSVPQELLSFHKEGISLLLWQSLIWKKLVNVDQSPLEAVAALKQYEEVQRELKVFESQLAIQWQ